MSVEKLLELRRKRSELQDEAKGILDAAEKAGRNLTKSEEARYNQLLSELKENREADSAMEMELVASDPGYSAILRNGQSTATLGELGGGLEGGFSVTRVAPVTDRTYRGMFHRNSTAPLSRGGFRDFDEFLQVLDSRRFDSWLELRTSRAFMESTPSLGGYAVPAEFAAWLLDNSLEDEIVRPRASVWPMTSLTLKAPAWDGQDHTSNLYGGFSGTWLSEGGTATRQTGKLRQVQLAAKKLGIYTQASRESLQDGITLEQQISAALVRAIGWYLDLAFLTGSGAGQPLGVLNSPSLVTVSKESGQAAATIVYNNLTKIFARMAPKCLKNSIWVCNNTAIPQLLTLSHTVGTGGSHIPVLQESGGGFKMLTRPVVFTEKVPALGTVGDIMLVDFSQYAIGLRQEVDLEKSNAPGWTEDLQDYRCILRADGQATWNEAITPKNGDSLSWCVVLQTRS